MIRSIPIAMLILAALAGPLAGQSTAAGGPGTQVGQAYQAVDDVTATQADPAAAQASGLPARAPQARTLRAHWHVFIAFAATWLLLFGYALSIGRRFGRLEDEVRRLRGSA